jgi:hypothetical protein
MKELEECSFSPQLATKIAKRKLGTGSNVRSQALNQRGDLASGVIEEQKEEFSNEDDYDQEEERGED